MCARRSACVFVISAALLALCLAAAVAVPLPFVDGFETVPNGYYPNLDGWQTWFAGYSAYVTNLRACNGVHSFRLQSLPFLSRCDCIRLDQTPNRLAYQASMYMDPVAGRAAWVGLAYGISNQMLTCDSFIFRNETGLVGSVYFAGAMALPPILLGTFATNQWVTVGADLDFKQGTADLWFNGALVATDVPAQPGEFDDLAWGHVALNRFAVGENNWAGGGYGVIYVDDVLIYEPVPPAIEAVVDIVPDTLNLRSRGQVVTCYIELPEDYSVADIDVSSLLLEETVSANPRPVAIGDYDYDGVPDLMVKFDRGALAALLAPGDQEVTLSGYLEDGTPLVGSDIVRAK
jgi:hypothetical protein